MMATSMKFLVECDGVDWRFLIHLEVKQATKDQYRSVAFDGNLYLDIQSIVTKHEVSSKPDECG